MRVREPGGAKKRLTALHLALDGRKGGAYSETWLLGRLLEEFPQYRLEDLLTSPVYPLLLRIADERGYARAKERVDAAGVKDMPSGPAVDAVLDIQAALVKGEAERRKAKRKG